MSTRAASEIRTLVEAIGSRNTVKREAAIARLAVIGRRAVDRLVVVYADPNTTRDTRIGILRVLEAAGDPRALAIGCEALHTGGDIAVAAAATLRGMLESRDAQCSASALDSLVEIAVDRTAERRVRLAAFEALQQMPADVRARVAATLNDDPDDAVWQDALEGRLPDDPAALRQAIDAVAASAPLSSLQNLIDAVKKRELEAIENGAEQWRIVRGALHQTLAIRGSTLAVYDLRETVERAAGPLPSSYLSALHLVGDETCLEPIAAAMSRSRGAERWQAQLGAAFAAILKRLRIRATSSTLKRVRTRWPDVAPALSMPSRTRARPRKGART